ncbi:hypothetical protein SNEBB_008352 [Seison nebaliae]|nr:hypothetical protein SNEBB_008352 [Seison nebaliae]
METTNSESEALKLLRYWFARVYNLKVADVVNTLFAFFQKEFLLLPTDKTVIQYLADLLSIDVEWLARNFNNTSPLNDLRSVIILVPFLTAAPCTNYEIPVFRGNLMRIFNEFTLGDQQKILKIFHYIFFSKRVPRNVLIDHVLELSSSQLASTNFEFNNGQSIHEGLKPIPAMELLLSTALTIQKKNFLELLPNIQTTEVPNNYAPKPFKSRLGINNFHNSNIHQNDNNSFRNDTKMNNMQYNRNGRSLLPNSIVEEKKHLSHRNIMDKGQNAAIVDIQEKIRSVADEMQELKNNFKKINIYPNSDHPFRPSPHISEPKSAFAPIPPNPSRLNSSSTVNSMKHYYENLRNRSIKKEARWASGTNLTEVGLAENSNSHEKVKRKSALSKNRRSTSVGPAKKHMVKFANVDFVKVRSHHPSSSDEF